jgi:hypothetical protein
MPFTKLRLLPAASHGRTAAGASATRSHTPPSAAPAAPFDDDQEARDLRHAECARQLASVAEHFARHPEALAKLERDMRAYERRAADRRNAEDNHDFLDGFEERWEDPYASTKRGL